GIKPRLSDLPIGDRVALMAPIIGLAALTCVIGLFPEPFVQFAETSAEQLLDSAAYVTTVLGVQP
ncbi:MAG: Na+/H+ antiporter subunit D, partial [Paracoccus sp. (in: a-proteobacteria)]|nr:Na+/H+ antiporter subunit D [Paracoccus sp. (in: a-proteobacteria)]